MSYKIKNPGGIQLDVDGNVLVDLQPSGVLQVTSDFGGFAEAWYDMGTTYNAIGFGANNYIEFTAGLTTFNPIGGNNDFRMEGDTDQNLFYLDASTDRIGIGSSSPSAMLDVYGINDTASSIMRVFGTGSTAATINYGIRSDNSKTGITTSQSGGFFSTSNTANGGSAGRTFGLVAVTGGTSPVYIGDYDIGISGQVGASNKLASYGAYFRNGAVGNSIKTGARIDIQGTTVSATTYGLELNNSAVSTSGFNVGLQINVNSTGSTNYGINLDCQGATTNYALLTQRGRVVYNNLQNTDSDFLVKGLTDSNLLFIDASLDSIGIGTTLPQNKVQVIETDPTRFLTMSVSTAAASTVGTGQAGQFSANATGTLTANLGLLGGAVNNNAGPNAGRNTGLVGVAGSATSWVAANGDVGISGQINPNSAATVSHAGYFYNQGTSAASATRYGVYSDVLGTETGNTYGGYFRNTASSAGASIGYGVDVDVTGGNLTNIALRLSAGGATTNNALISLQGGVVFNENGTNSDFRVEGDTETHLIFVDASADNVGIGMNIPQGRLHVRVDNEGDSALVVDGLNSAGIHGKNASITKQGDVTTTGTNTATIASITLGAGEQVVVDGRVIANGTGGVTVGGRFTAVAQNEAGTVNIIGVDNSVIFENSAGAPTFNVIAGVGAINIRVTGGGENTSWLVTYTYEIIGPPAV